MSTTLDLGRVDQLRIRLTYSSVLEGPAHDVFLLEARPRDSSARFDEAPYLELLEPVLHAHGKSLDPCVVHVSRTHRSWTESPGEAEIAISLSTGHVTAMEPRSRELVRSVFAKIVEGVEVTSTPALEHREAIIEAQLAVERAFSDVHADRLAVADEEHIAGQGMWSVGLVLPNEARFRVLLGFVDGIPGTTHIRCMPSGDIVGSMGAE